MTASAVSRPSPAAAVSSERGRTRRSRSAAVALIAAVALATTACSSDSDATPAATLPSTAPTTATTAPTTTSTTEPASPEEEVEQAYLDASLALATAAKSASVADPDVTATRTGPALETATDQLSKLKAAGLVVRYVNDESPMPSIDSIKIADSDTALVTYCLVDDAQQVRVADGEVVDDRVQSRRNEAEMRLGSDGWQLYNQRNLNTWDDDLGCDR